MPTRIFMMYCHCCKVTILANSRRCHGGSGSERAFHEHEPVAQGGWHFAARSDFAEAKALVYVAKIAEAITAGVGKGGKLRKAGDKRKNVRDAFRNAVNRAIKQIEKWDKPLAEHLKASIKHGNEVVYWPGMPIAWDVRSIVNA